ncbi:MAG: toll/interleukin-1 receptor domain-containing protein [Planctomycetaceae bacterium]|nr:toll/interleukin-1 receptor domain-containing protein [Planctomycetaceae bacterium]
MSTNATTIAQPQYAAFISYNQSHDEKLASLVRKHLQVIKSPLRKVRSVFRDKTDIKQHLERHPELAEALKGAMRESAFLILFASRKAAVSNWVEFEVATWIELRGIDRIVILVSDEISDFGAELFSLFPPSLKRAYTEGNIEPLCLDLRPSVRQRYGRAEFKDKLSSVVAAIDGVSLDSVVRRDVRFRRRKLFWGTLRTFIVFALGVTVGVLANRLVQ